MRFAALEEATGVSLSLTFSGPGGTGAAEFLLGPGIQPVAGAAPAP